MDTSYRIRDALLVSTSLTIVYALAFYWRLDKPFWAAYTVLIMVGLPTVGQTLQKGLLRIGGTLVGASSALLLFTLFQQNRAAIILALALYLGILLYLMQYNPQWKYFYFIAAMVGMIVVMVASQQPSQAWELAVARTEETLLGIIVHTTVSLVFMTPMARSSLEETMNGIVSVHHELDTASPSRIAGLRTRLNSLQEAATLLLPAVELESTVDFFRRRAWREALVTSRELADEQEKRLNAPAAASSTPSGTRPSPQTSTEQSIQHALLESRERLSIKRQRLHMLLDFLLHNGPKPVPAPPRHLEIRDALENEAKNWKSPVRLVILFLSVSIFCIVVDPSGIETMSFVELAMVFTLTGHFTGETPPSRFFWPFTRGVVVMFIPYAFIYPLLSDVTAFLALTFLCCFVICFSLAGDERKLDRLGYAIPWIIISQFTNTPHFSTLKYLAESVIIISGLMLLVVLQAIFFPGLQGQPQAGPDVQEPPHAA